MESNWQARSELLLGAEALGKLKNAAVAVFGIGGVGSYAAEALARAGIGRLLLVDGDVVSVTNINRQLIADTLTVGCDKVLVMKERIARISPEAQVQALKLFYGPQTAESVSLDSYDYVLDCIDTVSSKIELICRAKKAGVPVISCMGAGNKLDPTRLEVADIYKTSVCPLARIMRSELKKRGISSLKVVYSKEEPLKPQFSADSEEMSAKPGRPAPGSVSFVPSAAGLIMAGEAIKDIAVRK